MQKKNTCDFVSAAWIRTCDLQNYQFEQTGALATAAMKSSNNLGNFTWGNLDIKTKNGWGGKGRASSHIFLPSTYLHYVWS